MDSVHQDLWGRCQIPGEALPEAEVQHPRAGEGGLQLADPKGHHSERSTDGKVSGKACSGTR